jgi:predicted tellurium resistance membrane protein TerC
MPWCLPQGGLRFARVALAYLAPSEKRRTLQRSLVDMANLLTLDVLFSFLALTFLEVVLSVDNIVFVALAASRLEPEKRPLGRQLGLILALILRVGLLVGLVFLTRLDGTLFTIFGRSFSIKDLILVGGGLFLLWKGSSEIHETIDARDKAEEGPDPAPARKAAGLLPVILQIGAINIVFSLDSVITAVGMAKELVVMVAAVVIATLVMMLAARPAADFIERRPTAKMLALAFLLLVGVVLVADGTGFDVPRGYLYFAIAFSLMVEVLNTIRPPWRRKRRARPEGRST